MSKKLSRAAKARKEILMYPDQKRKAIDEFFLDIEKNPYAFMPDGSSKEEIMLQTDIKNAFLLVNRAKREITVLVCEIESIIDRMKSLMADIMENPLDDHTLAMKSIESMQLEIALIEDKIRNYEWDAEFYDWWLNEVKSGNPDVLDEDMGCDMYDSVVSCR